MSVEPRTADPVQLSIDGAIAVLRFNRRGRANALSFPIMQSLTDAAHRIAGMRNIAVVVLTGAPDVFSAGMDLRQDVFDKLDALSLEERRHFVGYGPRMVRAFAAIEAPVIAAVEGVCFGGGMVLAACADVRVAAKTARFAAPEVGVGLNMTWHSVPRLVRLVGGQATRRLLMLGDEWSAETAASLGFVDRVVERGAAFDTAKALGAHIAARPAIATRMVKRSIEAATHGGDTLLSGAESDLLMVLHTSEEFRAARERLTSKAT